jgi:hypothetical protein
MRPSTLDEITDVSEAAGEDGDRRRRSGQPWGARIVGLIPWLREEDPERATRSVLEHLSDDFAREYQTQVHALHGSFDDPAQLEARSRALVTLASHWAAERALLTKGRAGDPRAVRGLIRRLTGSTLEQLCSEAPGHHAARQALLRHLYLLINADAQLSSGLGAESDLHNGDGMSATVRRLVIPTDLLYQARCSLFPAERMLVVAGRRDGQLTGLGAVFDVTGVANGGHVDADPERLARALIAMDCSGTHLAMWVHSHPGRGATATTPSSTDLNQHRDWIRDYSPFLVSAIVVADGWIRFWGSALREERIEFELIGRGIVKEEESPDGHLYRFTE